MIIQTQLLHPRAILPRQATEGASGFDLCACFDAEGPAVIYSGDRILIPTGLGLAIPPGFEGQVRSRSGLAMRHGIVVLNSPGTIDSDYRGEIKVLLVNHGEHPVSFVHGQRIAQLVFAPVVIPDQFAVTELANTERGSGGFGSTGV